jgi:acetylornithine deacetylase/succinyl-diaminopimelate desuccinylase-like protein
MRKSPEVARLLQKLVRIPSVNPAGDPGTPHTGEQRMADFLRGYLKRLGARVDLQQVEKGRPNVIGCFKARGKTKRAIILESHTDTVSVLGMTIAPFGGEIRRGRVWGRGSCDTKGTMAAVLAAIAGLVRRRQLPQSTDLYFVGAMGEEAGNEGAIHLMKSHYFGKRGVRPEFAIATEPTELKIVYKHKGAMWLRISCAGRAVHGSKPELGINAVLKMQKALDFIVRKLPKLYASYRDPELGKPTFSVNIIRGGSKVNIVPDHCEIELDHRALPQEKPRELVRLLERNLPGFRAEIISSRPGLATSRDDPHIRRLATVIRRHGGPRNCFEAAPWFADCGVFGEAGIPSIAFGPGSILQAHTRDEFVEIDQLKAGEEIFTSYLKELE